jgi:hypothetical protein
MVSQNLVGIRYDRPDMLLRTRLSVRLATPFGRREIRNLKEQFPDKANEIDGAVRDYLKAEGPGNEAEFIGRLKRAYGV